MISCRLGCYIKKDKGFTHVYYINALQLLFVVLRSIIAGLQIESFLGISTSIFEMGCIRMDDGKKNLKFTDKKSQLWKDINDLGKKGQLIKKCEEEMCYVCLEG